VQNRGDEKCSEVEFYYGKNPNDFLKATANIISKNGEVLSIAEGEGRNAVFLAELGFKVTAMDYSVVGKDRALSFAHSRNVKIDYLIADLNDFQFPQKFDAVISMWSHMEKKLRKKFYAEVEENLKNGGVFILEAYNPKQLQYKTGGPSDLELLLTVDEVKSDFTKMEWIIAQDTIRHISEGTGHLGMSSTIQMLGIKK
jgi:SAM-dependent methyltransferase